MRINLRKLMQDRNLDRNHLALVLFPENKHPAMALTRLLANRNSMNEEQIFRLSMYTGLTVDALYTESQHWKTEHTGGLVRFTRDKYTAIYSPATGITKVYHLESLLATHVLSKPTQPLQEYLQEINTVIINNSIQK